MARQQPRKSPPGPQPRPQSSTPFGANAVRDGWIVSAHGRHYLVEFEDGSRLPCFPRGKKSDCACGDRVRVEQVAEDQGVIAEILPRRSLLYRSDLFKQKIIAANVTQVALVVACEPPFSEAVLTRCLVAAQSQDLRVLIVLNKCDLADRLPAAEALLAPLAALGYPILRLSAKQDASPLRAALEGQCTVLVGQSGMGKSTLINGLIPEARAATREISEALQSGKHTTTHATLYRIDDTSTLIDSPGLQEFGLAHLTRHDIEHGFPDLKPYLGKCRFRDCQHDREPDCAVRAAIAAGALSGERHALFLLLASEATGTALRGA